MSARHLVLLLLAASHGGSCGGLNLGLTGRVRAQQQGSQRSDLCMAGTEQKLNDGALEGLSPAEVNVANWIVSELGQAHLVASWEEACVADKKRLLQQVVQMDGTYPSDAEGRKGLAAYVAHARELLAESAADKNPFEGYAVDIPDGERMTIGSDAFRQDERTGMGVIQDSVFVLVAGGLGERLGYEGIKVELPTESLTGASFLETYITALLAMQEFGDKSKPVSLVIMTSNDTHDRTTSLLKASNFFGMKEEQIHFIKQENVPALSDNTAAFAVDKADPFKLQTKPHGHGDVHTLLHTSGLLSKFRSDGKKYVVFFQDTNVLAFKAIPAALGVSERKGFVMNSLTVPRSPGEAAGAICKLKRAGEPPLVINVEYNQLDALLKSSGTGGDLADETGYSPYPGNVNTLVMSLEPYMQALQQTGGSMPEFVNPKYANAERTVFKKPTRLECMMQDFPKLLGPESAVGFTDFERWFSFSPVKNSIDDAVKAHNSGVYAASPGAGEAAVYAANAQLLRLAGAEVSAGAESVYLDLPLNLSPAIALTPRFATTVDDIMSHVTGPVKIGARSSLVLDGDIELAGLSLDGALVIRAGPGVRIRVNDCSITNRGWETVALKEGEDVPPSIAIRGYRFEKHETVHIVENEPGDYILTGNGELRKA